jgi:hypothetical protein
MREDDLAHPEGPPGEGSRQLSADPVNKAGYLRCTEDREAYLRRLKAKNAASDEAFARRK